MKAIKDVLVVGDDCDGLLAAINLRTRLPDLRVQVLRLAVRNDFQLDGFAAPPGFLTFLHQELAIPPAEFSRSVRPTWRLGTRYEWGPRDFFDYTYQFQIDTKYLSLTRESGFYVGPSPRAFEAVGPASALMSLGKAMARGKDGRPQLDLSRMGYHLEHEALLRFLQTLALRAGVVFRDGQISGIVRNESGIASIELEGGQSLDADLFIDATGQQSLLLGAAMEQPLQSFGDLPCDRALVATWPRHHEPILAHATVHTMPGGWSWRSEHERFIAAGYAFSSRHITKEQAELELRQIYPQCGLVRLLEMKQGRRNDAWCGNVIGIGNSAALVEPLAAAGPATVAFQSQWLARTLIDCDMQLRPSLIKQYNKRWRRLVEHEREFLGLFYRFNTRHDNAFWAEARQNSRLGDLEPLLRCYQDIGPDSLHRSQLIYEADPIGLEGYFSVLVGQNVPWSNPWKPSGDEMSKMATIVEGWRRVAENAYTATQATELLLRGTAPQRAETPLSMPHTGTLRVVA